MRTIDLEPTHNYVILYYTIGSVANQTDQPNHQVREHYYCCAV